MKSPSTNQGDQNHRRQPDMAGEFYPEISSVNTAIAGGWVLTFSSKIMLQFRTAIIGLTLLFITGCKSDHEPHNSGIGRIYTFTSVNLISSTGVVFSFTAAEMRDLEKVWSPPIMPGSVAICNALTASSPKLRYSFVLNDGYSTETLDAYLGVLSGADCLGMTLEADGGGFTADVYTRFVPITSVLSPARRSELNALLVAEVSPVHPTKTEGDRAGASNGG